jgi:uncharacterized protein (TIGR03435 family)
MMTNSPIRSVILNASPVDGVREILGLPDWVNTERYDLTAKPPAGTTRDQMRPMWMAFFADRMKLVAHVEQQERTTFAMVIARSDGRLGPQLKKSALDCSPPAPGAPPPPPPAPPQPGPGGLPDFTNRCGMMMGRGTIVTGGVPLDQLARSLGNMAGGFINNRTGLDGFYAFTLTFTPPGGAGPAADASADNPPEILTALQEQLGLKLQPEKTIVPILVIDHIERPTPN